MNLSLRLAQVAQRSPDNPAILWPGGTLSYGGFEDQVARIAGALRDRGFAVRESGDTLSISR